MSARRSSLAWMLALGALASTAGAAEAPATLKFGEAVGIAVRGATSVQVAGTRVSEAEAKAGSARAALLPDLNGTASASDRTFNLKSFGIEFPGPSLPAHQGPVGLADARLRASQSLIDAASYKRIHAAGSDVRAASLDRDAVSEEAAEDAAMAYLNAVKTKALAEARASDAQLASELLGLASDQLHAGTAPAIDTTRAGAAYAAARGALLIARNQSERARIDLARALSLDPTSPPAIADTLSEALGSSDVPLDDAGATTLAFAHRPELAAEAARLKRDQSERSAIAAERWPRLGVNADWGVSGQNFPDAFPTYEVGLAVSLPIFDGFERESRIAESTAGIRRIELREKDLRDRIAAEVKSTLLDLSSGHDQLDVARERVRLAEQEMNQARERFVNGLAGNIEVVNAQVSLVRARDALIDARFTIAAARVSVARAAGVARTMH